MCFATAERTIAQNYADTNQHIDYSLYQVLPMAVTVDVLLAVRIRKDDHKVRVANVNPEKFPAREFEIPQNEDIEIDSKVHEWSNYFKAGLRGASELLKKKKSGRFTSVGMDVLIDGSVPAGGGLSSSAAFVCASALAVMRANGESIVDKTELTELAIVSERAVGVNSGGYVMITKYTYINSNNYQHGSICISFRTTRQCSTRLLQANTEGRRSFISQN
jgi:galactokinase